MNQLTTLYISITLAVNVVFADDHHIHAPSVFTGVRGKKMISDFAYFIHRGSTTPEMLLNPLNNSVAISDKDNRTVKKRTPSGFMGNRGNKPFSYVQPWEGTYQDALKRTPSGFMGMRGKKDNEYGYGKKNPSGFFGMRGKKYPYEFRGKFVGVRGKKMSNQITNPNYYSDLDLERLGEKLYINQLMLLLTEQGEADALRKENYNQH